LTEEEILGMWAKDCQIDRNQVANESANVPTLHIKYFTLFLAAKRQVVKMEHSLATLKKEKHEVYTQGPTKENKAKYQFQSFPPKGAAQKKAEVALYIESDPEYITLTESIFQEEQLVTLLGAILKEIGDRKWHLQTILKWDVFKNGG
jgi:hypothetical protein